MNNMKIVILEKAIPLFKQRGFDKVSVMEICNACNVTKGSFYHHYNSKNDLLRRYYQVMMSAFIDEMNNSTSNALSYEKVWEIVVFIYNLATEIEFDLFRVISIHGFGYKDNSAPNNSKSISTESKAYFDFMVEAVKIGQSRSVIRSGAEATEMIHTILACFMGLWADWNFNGRHYNLKSKFRRQFVIIFMP